MVFELNSIREYAGKIMDGDEEGNDRFALAEQVLQLCGNLTGPKTVIHFEVLV